MSNKLKSEIQKPKSEIAIPDRVLVVGLGTSGVSCVKLLSSLGVRVTATDMKSERELSGSLEALAGTSFSGRFGGHDRKDFLDHDLVVVSPGIATNHPFLEEARQDGAKVIGEIELASQFIEEPIIAVTGTNGKTTTTTLLGQVFKRAFGEEEVFVGGNIGNPLVDYVLSGLKVRYVIAEVSSFQLETIETFRSHTAILLNITEDHLDRYTSFSDYVWAKMQIFRNQREDDYALFNTEVGQSEAVRARKLFFSTTKPLDEGAFLDKTMLRVRINGEEFAYRREDSPLVGIHNSENILSVLLTCHLYGIEKSVVEETIKTFKGLAHRVEFVRELKGVKFYNDSKATNVDATKRALESMDARVILIAGGKDKGGSYGFITPFAEKIRGLILFGEAKKRIETELAPTIKTFVEADLANAVQRSFDLARTGDVVLFSPMCSSFDMFENYKARGNTFRQLVEAL